jgi:RecA-family ATPase
MYSLRKFAGRTGSLGTPLPDPFDIFDQARIRFRRGGTSLIAGAPGSYKSVLALNMLTKWAETHSVLYFSADSDELTVAKRLASILTGHDTETVERRMIDPAGRDRYREVLAQLDNARFVYRSLDMEVIENHLEAFEAVHGCHPDVIFIDNLIDTVDDPTDWGGMIHFIKQCDILSRETGSHVCILHHASESWAQGHPGMPPPSWAVQGKVNQIPRLVLTVASDDSSILKLACVKNTNGPQYPMANVHHVFHVQPSLRVDPFE